MKKAKMRIWRMRRLELFVGLVRDMQNSLLVCILQFSLSLVIDSSSREVEDRPCS